jgi:putrescine aminotransferase
MEVSRVALAEKLIEITNSVMPFKKRVFFEVSGATAVNLAAKIAQITDLRRIGLQTSDFESFFNEDIFIPSRESICRFSFLAFRNAFHGRHGIAQLLTNSKPKQLWAVSSSCAVGRLPFPIQGICKRDLRDIGIASKIITELENFAPVIAFVFEPVQGEGGINIPDDNLLNSLINGLRARGIYIIADEVQTGLGRTGKMFACEHFGIQPDMMVLSKSLGAGIPISAVIVNAEKFPDLEPGMHSGSHHASPLAVAAAIANINKIERENLVEQSANHGVYVLRRLQEIAKSFPSVIQEARGKGLMLGIEFKSQELRNAAAKKCIENGLLLAGCGEAVIRMTPALVVTIDEIEDALNIFIHSICRALKK